MTTTVEKVTSMLSESKVEDGKEVSFAGRKLKLDCADDGKLYIGSFYYVV